MSPPIDIDGSEIQKATIDGEDVSEITIDGQQTADFFDIPDSVVYQHDAIADWTSGDGSIPDSVGSEPISLTGDFQDGTIGGKSGINGDGTDDYGLATTQSVFEQTSFGIATTIAVPSGETEAVFGVSNSGSGTDRVLCDFGAGVTGGQGVNGAINFEIVDANGNGLGVATDATFDDGSNHAVIINKSGNSVGDISIYVDDMSTAQSDSDIFNENYDPSNHSQSRDLAYFARNNGGSITNHLSMIAGVFEFNNQPYSQSERDSFVSRRPEV